ncbi:MAG: LytTR family DNA-binding domain-containing protein [Deltaproteobacteria bacterium]|nr:LytTR family DNA-binding domain-containing protein [Deltaproteobacteria bacterium]
MSYRVLLVDDESLARLRLRQLLSAHPELEIVAEADSVAAARARLAEHQIDLLFLDVQMPGGSGFGLCDGTVPLPHVVFVTAYEQHALRAFEVNALDYLLKPVHPERLASCLRRLSGGARPGQPLAADDRVSVPVGRGLQLVAVDEIRHIRAEGDYTELHLRDGSSPLCSLSMREWERRLPPDAFARIHRSSIVALAEIQQLTRRGRAGHMVILRSGERLEVSRRLAGPLRERLGPSSG